MSRSIQFHMNWWSFIWTWGFFVIIAVNWGFWPAFFAFLSHMRLEFNR